MTTLICKKSIKLRASQLNLFIEGREYHGTESGDKFVFLSFQGEALPHHAARVNIKTCFIKEYFRPKELKFGR